MATSTAGKEKTPFQVRGLSGLSPGAAAFLKRHPSEARLAVTAALEAAAIQYGIEAEDARSDVPVTLAPFVIDRSSADLIGVSEAASRLKVSRTTIYEWVEKGMLLGWRATKRGLKIPAEQILGPGKVVPGLAEVVEIIGDPELAWAFLSEEQPFADEVSHPISLLKAGRVDDVVGAAASFGTATA